MFKWDKYCYIVTTEKKCCTKAMPEITYKLVDKRNMALKIENDNLEEFINELVAHKESISAYRNKKEYKEAKGLSIGDKSIEVDDNGFLNLVEDIKELDFVDVRRIGEGFDEYDNVEHVNFGVDFNKDGKHIRDNDGIYIGAEVYNVYKIEIIADKRLRKI